MVIKGRSRSNGVQLANYLLQSKENDRARILDVRGTAQPDDLLRSLREMSMTSELTKRGKLGLYHAQVNPAIGEDHPMTYDDWLKAADILEHNLGFDGQKRAIVLHEKNGRVHGHIVWERYDHDTGKLRADGKNYKQHDQARAQIEQEFGHQRTPQRADREPTDKERLTQLWQEHPEGRQFIEEAEKAGYIVAQGNARRPFRVVTPDGQSLDLTRQLDDKAKAVRDRLNPIRADLPTEAEALQQAKTDRQPKPEQSDNSRELSDSQDLAAAMLNRNKTPEAEQKMSFGFTVNQTLKTPSEMLYSDLLAQQQANLEKLNIDYAQARADIKKMQSEHYDAAKYQGEIERLAAAHERQKQALEASFAAKQKEFLKEPPSLPRQPDEKNQSDKKPELSDNQDKAAAMLEGYRQRQAERQQKVQEARNQAKEQTAPANDNALTDTAAQMLENYRKRQEEKKRQRDREHREPEL